MYPSFTSNGAMRCFLGIKSIFLPPTSMIPNLSGSAGDTENVLCMKGVAILKFYSAAIFSLTQFFSHITAWQCIPSPRAIFCDSLTDDIKQESYNWIFTSPRVFTLLKLSLPRGGGGEAWRSLILSLDATVGTQTLYLYIPCFRCNLLGAFSSWL